jgi:hypothetical protein
MANPALFYFWSHDAIEELTTETCETLVKRAGSVFLESSNPDISLIERIENSYNQYSLNGISPETLEAMKNLVAKFLVSLTQGTGKTFVFEKSLLSVPAYDKEDDASIAAFFNQDTRSALIAREFFLTWSEAEQKKREAAAVADICNMPDTPLVIFGVAHLALERMVSAQRPTEIYFPYKDYKIPYKAQERQFFRKTGTLNTELHAKVCIEGAIRMALRENYADVSRKNKEYIIHYYTERMQFDQIIRLKEYFVACSRFAGLAQGDVFESFLKKDNLPAVQEVLGQQN